jgi:hypothetical protein
VAVRLKLNALANLELQHLNVRSHLPQEPQAFDDPMVEVDQFCFTQTVNVNLHRSPSQADPVTRL